MKVYIGVEKTTQTLSGFRIVKVFLSKEKSEQWRKEDPCLNRFIYEKEAEE